MGEGSFLIQKTMLNISHHIEATFEQKKGLKGPLENYQTFIRFGGIVLYDDNVDRVPA